MAFRDYILHNFWWKLLSLLLAALTWLTIVTISKKEETLRDSVVTGSSSRSFPSVPVTLLSSAANAGRFTISPSVVTVEVSGKLEDLEKLQPQDIRAYVDVTETDDEIKFSKTIQVQTPTDFKAVAVPPVAKLERLGNPR